MNGESAMATRRYGAAIAVASGGYAVLTSTEGAMGTGEYVMLLVGLVAVAHGVVLVTGFVDRIGDASGPLMVAYALLMLGNQAIFGPSMGPDGGMDGRMAAEATMGYDLGMVVLALLMLVSGLLMASGDDGT